jgi:hypothetical protein
MAIVGHWANLAEAQKLTQSVLLQGVIQTVIESGNLIPRFPIKQIHGKDLLYNREKTYTASGAAQFIGIREQIPWTSDVDIDQITVALERIARQDPIDNFVRSSYDDPNDYSAIMMEGLVKKVTRFMEHMIIYGDKTYSAGNKEFDGLHAFGAAGTGDLNIDSGGALSLMNLRKMLDAMKVDNDGASSGGKGGVILLTSKPIARRLDAGVQEAGLARSSVTHQMSQMTFNLNDLGQRVSQFDGVPFVKSDFLDAEQASTGEGSNAMAVNTSGTKEYSIFGVRFGHTEDGGLEMLLGGQSRNVADIFEHTHFDVLEDYDSGGDRLVTYASLALGAVHSVGRIFGITDAEITP